MGYQLKTTPRMARNQPRIEWSLVLAPAPSISSVAPWQLAALMANEAQHDAVDADSLLGSTHLLALGLGDANSAEPLAAIAAMLRLGPIRTLPHLRHFLEAYRNQVLVPLELPAVQAAYRHAERGETHELLDLDRALTAQSHQMPFAEMSALVGRTQLRRLKPMRGNRTLSRYIEAVGQGQARGWHTVAYGVMLASFSLPLRQGLVRYAETTAGGFLDAASAHMLLRDADRETLLDETGRQVVPAVNALLSPAGISVV